MIEIPIGTKFLINSHLCICRELTDRRKKCSKCYYKHCGVRFPDSSGKYYACGSIEVGNCSNMLCEKDERTDRKDVYYELVD